MAAWAGWRLTGAGIVIAGLLAALRNGRAQQARTEKEVEVLVEHALELESAGIFALVLEAVPSLAAERVTAALSIPTIGIGAGPHCDGQVLVSTEMLGLFKGYSPRFTKRYANLRQTIAEAAVHFAEEVRGGTYPDDAHSYNWKLRP